MITAVSLVTAGAPTQRCDQPEAAASALGIPGVARVDNVETDADFPDDRKGSLAAEALRKLGPLPAGARSGIFLGTGLSSLTPAELETDLFPHLENGKFNRELLARQLRTDHPSPRRHQPERVTAVLGKRIGAIRAETNFSACAAAAQSIAAAARSVARGEVDVALAGGHDSMLHPIGYLSFVVLGALSPSRGRPFDQQRDGFMIGEGAALLQLERESDARARGATVLARFLGSGTSVDAYNVTAPHPEGRGAALAMRRAIRDAGLSPSDIGYVNAHGTGTPVGDRAESQAIVQVLGDVPVSSFKGAFGHTIAAAGAVELGWCVRMLSEGVLYGTVGLEQIDSSIACRVLRETVPGRPNAILSNSFGFGGQNCALVVGRA